MLDDEHPHKISDSPCQPRRRRGGSFSRAMRGLVDGNSTMMMLFVHHALSETAWATLQTDPAEITHATNGWVDGDAWFDCAREVIAKLGYPVVRPESHPPATNGRAATVSA